MPIGQLQPNPRPGPFTSEVNVNELNRLLRELDTRIGRLDGQISTASSSVESVAAAIAVSELTVGIGTFTITSNVDDYPIGTVDIAKLVVSNNDPAFKITGVEAQPDGTRVRITNLGPGNVVLAHQDASSAENNRLSCQGSGDIVLPQTFGAELLYESAAGRWVTTAL